MGRLGLGCLNKLLVTCNFTKGRAGFGIVGRAAQNSIVRRNRDRDPAAVLRGSGKVELQAGIVRALRDRGLVLGDRAVQLASIATESRTALIS